MLISRKWLSQYIDISKYSIKELADKITSAGSEVEGIKVLALSTNLVIGEVIECIEHPDSDHLHCCKVNIGSDVLPIVCGAPNVGINKKVIVAKVGAKLPQMQIKEGIIRGEVSKGMLCSLIELGVDSHELSEDSKNGIEILDDEAIIGDEDPLKFLGLDDEILDISLTPNRNDCLSAWAFAYECGAVLNEHVKLPELLAHEHEIASSLTIDIKTAACPAFYGKRIGNIKISQSPKWMRELLRSSGIKSINNIVDISNIVMLETGQPLHFYDDRAIDNGHIEVVDNLTIDYTALDSNTYKVQQNDIMITTNNKPIGIAGIMGGNDSKIKDDTTSIVIEAAIFNSVSIRNTARRFALSTEASMHYQKGIEPLAAQKAIMRATDLLVKYADASLLEKTTVYDIQNKELVKINLSLNKMAKVLGIRIEADEVMKVLMALQFNPSLNQDIISVTIPSFRQDVKIEEDVIEEVIRIVGYDSLPQTLPLMSSTLGTRTPKQKQRQNISHMLAHLGLQEVISYTLIGEQKKAQQVLAQANNVELALPMSEDRKYVRGSILPSILECCAYNQARSIMDFGMFEISNVYGVKHCEEHLAILMSGDLQQLKWQKWKLRSDFYTMKGYIIALCEQNGIERKRLTFENNNIDIQTFHPHRSATVLIDQQVFGLFGDLHPSRAKELDISGVIACELILDVLMNAKASKVKNMEISKFPSVTRDIALVVKRNVILKDIYNCINKNGKVDGNNWIQDIAVFDVYEGEHVNDDEKSIALRITFQSFEKTLEDKNIQVVHQKIIDALKNEVKALLRT